MKALLLIVAFMAAGHVFPQIAQTHRYELKKENNDDFFTVLPAGEDGVIILRDTDDFRKGDIWQITSLDTALVECWQTELALNTKYIFKGYNLAAGRLHLLFREGEYEKKNYHLISVGIAEGTVQRFDIHNEIPLELTHMEMVNDRLILAGYVNLSPALVSYTPGSKGFEVIPGFFKDKSIITDLHDNENATFNAVMVEKDYRSDFLRMRTYGIDGGDILFEREVRLREELKILGARTSSFINGNIVLAGTYGTKTSNYAIGVYFAIVKPPGQDNVVRFYDFSRLKHFFDYMPPGRAERVRSRLARKAKQGKEFYFPSRLILHDIRQSSAGYLITAELFDPEYDRLNYNVPGFDRQEDLRERNTTYTYVRHPERLQRVDNADRFEYLQSVVLELDRDGELLWDNSLKIEGTKRPSLQQVVHVTQAKNESTLCMMYRTDKEVIQKMAAPDTAMMTRQPIKLIYDTDAIAYTYEGAGGSHSWYDHHFIIWGFHKVKNKEDENDNVRSVLYINKADFEWMGSR